MPPTPARRPRTASASRARGRATCVAARRGGSARARRPAGGTRGATCRPAAARCGEMQREPPGRPACATRDVPGGRVAASGRWRAVRFHEGVGPAAGSILSLPEARDKRKPAVFTDSSSLRFPRGPVDAAGCIARGRGGARGRRPAAADPSRQRADRLRKEGGPPRALPRRGESPKSPSSRRRGVYFDRGWAAGGRSLPVRADLLRGRCVLVILGSLWPLLGFPFAVTAATQVRRPGWRWAALCVLPALVCAVHYLFVLPRCLPNGNLMAAVVFGLLALAAGIYFPVLVVLGALAYLRRGAGSDGQPPATSR